MKRDRRNWRLLVHSAATLLLLLLAAGCCGALATLALRLIEDSRRWRYFGAGCAATIILLLSLFQLWRRRWLPGLTQQFLFLHRFNHELAHAVAALATGSPVSSFQVSSGGGAVQVDCGRLRGFVVAIAPYVLSMPLMLLGTFMLATASSGPQWWALAGAAYTYHVLNIAVSISPRQSDFQELNYVLCLAWIAALLLLVSALTAALVAGDASLARAMMEQCGWQAADLARTGAGALRHWINEARHGV